MDNSRTFKKVIDIVSFILAIAGIIYLSYKAYIDIYSIKKGLNELINHHIILFTEILLMIVNVGLESYRWLLLDNGSSRLTYRKSVKTIFESISLSSFTPLGIGEHIAKVRNSNKPGNSIIASLMGSFIQTCVIFLFGIIGITINNRTELLNNHYIILFIFIALLSIVALVSTNNKVTNKIKCVISEYKAISTIEIFIINILRYLVFSYQLYLLLTLSFTYIDINLIANIFIYYLIITFIPSVGLADVGIRGSVALYIFGNNQNIIWTGIAIIMIWLINRVVPSFIGSYFIIKNKD